MHIVIEWQTYDSYVCILWVDNLRNIYEDDTKKNSTFMFYLWPKRIGRRTTLVLFLF